MLRRGKGSMLPMNEMRKDMDDIAKHASTMRERSMLRHKKGSMLPVNEMRKDMDV